MVSWGKCDEKNEFLTTEKGTLNDYIFPVGNTSFLFQVLYLQCGMKKFKGDLLGHVFGGDVVLFYLLLPWKSRQDHSRGKCVG